jgi:hypothetical protein
VNHDEEARYDLDRLCTPAIERAQAATPITHSASSRANRPVAVWECRVPYGFSDPDQKKIIDSRTAHHSPLKLAFRS